MDVDTLVDLGNRINKESSVTGAQNTSRHRGENQVRGVDKSINVAEITSNLCPHPNEKSTWQINPKLTAQNYLEYNAVMTKAEINN